jgi:hypothetical protein
VVFALVFVAIAGVASAQQQVCISVDDQFPTSPPLLYRLNLTDSGQNTRSIVGTAAQGGAGRVVTGGGALIAGRFEISLRSTDIFTPPPGGDPALLVHTTHVLLNGPGFSSGPFQSVHIRYFESPQGLGQITAQTRGTATVVPCPPLG